MMISQCSTKRYVGYEIRIILVKQIRPLRDYDFSVFDIILPTFNIHHHYKVASNIFTCMLYLEMMEP